MQETLVLRISLSHHITDKELDHKWKYTTTLGNGKLGAEKG